MKYEKQFFIVLILSVIACAVAVLACVGSYLRCEELYKSMMGMM